MEPTATLIAVTLPIVFDEPLDLIEYAGRVDYGPNSRAKMGDREIIGRWIASGHESMVEMADATFEIECSRVVSHELVRHRIASYQQESQRYVRYDEEEPEDLFFVPPELDPTERIILEQAYEEAARAYKKLKVLGVKSQLANLREWRHFCRLRCHPSAQPEMQVIANQILDQLIELYPEVFADVEEALEAGRRAIR
jgi:thymidylate synthase (FAD)